MRNVKLGVGAVLLLVGLFFAYRAIDLNKQVGIAEESMAGASAALSTGCGPLVAAVPPASLEGFVSMSGEVDLENPCARAIRDGTDPSMACSGTPRTAALGVGGRALLPALEQYDCRTAIRSNWSIIQSNASTLDAYDSLRYTCAAIGLVALLAGAGLLALTLRAKPAAAPPSS